jgi:hypothetical protein
MQFRGGGIGHITSQHWDTFLCADGNDEKRGPEMNRDGKGDEIEGHDAGNEVSEAEEDEEDCDNDNDSRSSGDNSNDISDDDSEDSDDRRCRG